jgi:hypothetical protein
MKFKVLLLTVLLGVSVLSINAYDSDKKECNQYLDCKYYQNVNIINLHYENDGKSVKLVQPNNSFHYKKTK